MSFGRHLRALRDEAGLSRAELARRAGVPASTLGNWEGGRGFPSLAACLQLAGALGVPVERFAEGGGRPHRGRAGARREKAAPDVEGSRVMRVQQGAAVGQLWD
jgi:putative transcriptional regulator